MIRAGYDPGSSHCALVIASGEARPLRLILARTHDVGAVEQLEVPKVYTRADGQTVTRSTRRVLTHEHIHEHAATLLAELQAHGVTHLTIEEVEHVHLGPDMAAARSIATALLRTAKLAAVVGERARAAGITVERVTRARWIGRVVERVKGQRGGEQAARIPASVAAGFVNWPETSDEHERDAGGVCLYSVTPERVKARRVAAGAGGAPREPRPARAAPVKRSCACMARHRRDCPQFVAAPPKEPKGYADWKARQGA